MAVIKYVAIRDTVMDPILVGFDDPISAWLSGNPDFVVVESDDDKTIADIPADDFSLEAFMGVALGE